MIRASLLLLLAASATAQGTDLGHRTWLWLEAKHPRTAALADALWDFGIVGIVVEPGDDVARLDRLGIPYYLDQVVSGGTLHVKPDMWKEAVTRSRAKKPDDSRPRCLSDPAVLAAAEKQITDRLSALGKSRPAFVSLRDEPSFTRLLNPIDWCRAPASRREFAKWLDQRWGGIAHAREAWGLSKDSDVLRWGGPDTSTDPSATPPLTSDVRDRFFHGEPEARELIPWNDARDFADTVFASTVDRFAAHARARLSGVPVGILGGQMPHAFGGFDWGRLLGSLDVVEAYDYGGALEIVRSLRTPRTRLLHTVFPPKEAPAAASVHALWHGFFHGTQEAVLFKGDDIFPEGDVTRRTPWANSLAPTVKALASPRLGMWRRATPLSPQVAILVDMPSIRLGWLLDTRNDGHSWRRRLTSYATHHSTQARTRVAWIALLEDLGLRYTFVTPLQVDEGMLTRPSLQALVLPRNLALGSRTVARTREFLQRGGLVVADCQPGLYTGQLARRKTGALDTLFGVRRTDFRSNLDGPHQGTPHQGLAPRRARTPGGRRDPSPSGLGLPLPPGRAPGGGPARTHPLPQLAPP